MTVPPDAAPDADAGSRQQPPQTPRTIKSEELLKGRRELLIEHGNEVYRLRLTRNGKLILQK